MPPAAATNAMFTITVPPIACSFPWTIHPGWPQLKELSDAWVVKRCSIMMAACQGETAASSCSPAGLISSAYDLLACLSFAHATCTHDQLVPVLKLMSWYFMLDNFLDDPSEMGADLAQADCMVDRVVAEFNRISSASMVGEEEAAPPLPNHFHPVAAAGDKQLQLSRDPTCSIGSHAAGAGEHPESTPEETLVKCMADSAREWWEEMRLKLMTSPSQQARFSKLFIQYLQSNSTQVRLRENRYVPDLQAYLEMREQSLGWYPLAVLTESCLGIELDREALTHPLLISLHQRVCKHICLANDIVSFGMEYKQGDLFNVVSVLSLNKSQLLLQLLQVDDQPHKQLPDTCTDWQALLSPEMLQEGMLEASDMLKETDRDCVRLMREIRASPLLMGKPGMEAYINSIAHFVGGNVYWHLVSARYGLCTSSSNSTYEPPDLTTPHYHRLPCPSLDFMNGISMTS